MKVLYYTNIPSPYRMVFFEKLGEKCDLTVLFDRKDADDRHENWMGDVNKVSSFKSVVLKGLKLKGDTAFCPEIIKYIRDKRYDVIIIGDYATINGMYAIAYMNRHGIKYGIECDGGFVRSTEKQLLYLVKKYFISKASFGFSPGATTNEYLTHYGMDESKIWFYPFTSLSSSDIELNRLSINKRDKYRDELQVGESFVILTVGSMIYRKGIDILLKAASKLSREIQFIIVGGNPTADILEITIQNQLSNVTFVEFQKKEELVRYYAVADLFVLPTREDIWGLVIGEAMSFGLPVITTNKCVAGVELISDAGGIIVESDNEDVLADAIDYLYRHKEVLDAARQRNVEVIRQYSIENMVDSHVKTFSTIGRRKMK